MLHENASLQEYALGPVLFTSSTDVCITLKLPIPLNQEELHIKGKKIKIIQCPQKFKAYKTQDNHETGIKYLAAEESQQHTESEEET